MKNTKNFFKNLIKNILSIGAGGGTTYYCISKTDFSEEESVLIGAGTFCVTRTVLDKIINTDPKSSYQQACEDLENIRMSLVEDDGDEDDDIPFFDNDEEDDDDEEEEEEDDEDDQRDTAEAEDVISENKPQTVPKITEEDLGDITKTFKEELSKEIDKLFKKSNILTEDEYERIISENPVTENGICWKMPKHNNHLHKEVSKKKVDKALAG